ALVDALEVGIRLRRRRRDPRRRPEIDAHGDRLVDPRALLRRVVQDGDEDQLHERLLAQRPDLTQTHRRLRRIPRIGPVDALVLSTVRGAPCEPGSTGTKRGTGPMRPSGPGALSDSRIVTTGWAPSGIPTRSRTTGTCGRPNSRVSPMPGEAG